MTHDSGPSAPDSQDAPRFVEEIMSREAELAAQGRPEPPKPRLGRSAALVIVPLAVVAIAVNVIRFTRSAQPFTAEQERAGVELTIYLAAQEIESHRQTTGQLPATLEELGLDDDGLTYERAEDTYRISAWAGDAVVEYHSTDHPAVLAHSLAPLDGGAP